MNRNGFSLIELLMVVAIASITSLAMASLMSQVFQSIATANDRFSLNQLRTKIMRVYTTDYRFEELIKNNNQVDLEDTISDWSLESLLIPHTPVDRSFADIPLPILHDPDAAVPSFPFPTPWYDSRNSSQGFNLAGVPCTPFGTPQCPLRFTATWTPICPNNAPAPCVNPRALVSGSFTFNSGGIWPRNVAQINVSRLDFRIDAGSQQTDNILACRRVGGAWDTLVESCNFNQQYCNDPRFPERRIFRGWTTDGQPICESVIRAGDAQGDIDPQDCGPSMVVRGVKADGTLRCGAPLKNQDGGVTPISALRCNSSERQIGVNQDGSPQCAPLISGSTGSSSGLFSCNAGEKVNSINRDGSVNCVAINDAQGPYSCAFPLVIGDIQPNGTVTCVPNGDATCGPGKRRNAEGRCVYMACIERNRGGQIVQDLLTGFEGDGDPICLYIEEREAFWDESPGDTSSQPFACPQVQSPDSVQNGIRGNYIQPEIPFALPRSIYFSRPSLCQGVFGVRENGNNQGTCDLANFSVRVRVNSQAPSSSLYLNIVDADLLDIDEVRAVRVTYQCMGTYTREAAP